ncbi:MAG: phosphate acyltransferase, partial [Pseudomonadota bacterium]|nr:phosphate acyltransferase [Pseudomonadota bacterium]
MGGDHAPEMVVAGLVLAVERHPDARFLLVGDEARVAPLLVVRPRAATACT